MSNEKIRLNCGCGVHTTDEPGWVNVDKYAEKLGIVQYDLEFVKGVNKGADIDGGPDWMGWPWRDNTVDTVLFNHSLEHMGQNPNIFLAMVKELYRVCCDGATIYINAPHHRHDEFWGDPTHVRPITPDMWVLFSKKANEHFRAQGGANSCFAFLLNVDFELVRNDMVLDERFAYLKDDPSWQRMTAINANVVKEIRLQLRVIKPGGSS